MNHPSRRSILSAVSVTALTGILTACGSGTGARKASAGASGGTGDLVIGLTYTPNIQFAPFYLALRNDQYASGVSLRHHGEQEGRFDALLAGTEQLVVAGADEAVVAASNGNDLVVIGGFYQRYPGCVIVPEDSEMTDLAALRGRTIGTPGNSGETWYSLLVALSTAGLGQDDVTIQEIGYTQQAALASGKVDAVVGYSNNDAVQLAQNGTAVRTLAIGEDVPLVGASLITSSDALSTRRDELAEVVAASATGMTSFIDDPDAAVEATEEYVPDLADTTQAAHAREVAVATGDLVRGDGTRDIGSVRVEDIAPMIDFLSSYGLLGEEEVRDSDVCVPLGQ